MAPPWCTLAVRAADSHSDSNTDGSRRSVASGYAGSAEVIDAYERL
jgi:hypothetical protein